MAVNFKGQGVRLRLFTQTLLSILVACTLGCDGFGRKNDGRSFEVERHVPKIYKEHESYFQEGIYQLGELPIWVFVENQSFGNINMIEGEDGLIIIDTSINLEDAKKTQKRIEAMNSKPVLAVIYTHHHVDHTSGTTAFISSKAAEQGKVKVIASDNFMREYTDENAMVGPIMAHRAMYMYGVALEPEDKKDYHVGCCGYMKTGSEVGFIPPNTLVEDQLSLNIAGIELDIFKTGGESASHIAIYLPEQKVLFAGDEIQGPTMPQLHSLRGTKFRDAVKWYQAIDKMRALEVDYLVPSHGKPVTGIDESKKIITSYRDAIQYQHDQSVRFINKGYTADQLANTIKLPEFLEITPWTLPFYGAIKSNVRNFYHGYISWWNGDPADLDPLPEAEFAKRFVKGFGGRDEVMRQAEDAFHSGDFQWAAELTKYLVRIDQQDFDARNLKAASLKAIGYKQTSSSWRSFYLTAARELEGSLDPTEVRNRALGILSDPEELNALPSRILLNALKYRIDPNRAKDNHVTVGFYFIDTQEHFTLELRNSILDVRERKEETDVYIEMPRLTFNKIIAKKVSFEDLASNSEDEKINLEGSKLKLISFVRALDRDDKASYLSVR